MAGPLTQARLKRAPAAGGFRPIQPISLAAGPTSPEVVPAMLDGNPPPTIEWVAPSSLFVEDAYQRQLSRNSLTLIRKIVAGWNWAHVKPPIVARLTEAGLREKAQGALSKHSPCYAVIDGQHTAIAAVTHGGIARLPVVVVTLPDEDLRARAFIAHNRDRLHLTPMQMHYAALAAGDEAARAVNAACLLAGVHICRVQPAAWKPGDTVAVAAIAALVKSSGAEAAAGVLEILAEARRAPIAADEIKAVHALLHDEARPCAATELAAVVKSDTREVWQRLAGPIAQERKVPLWRALADLWRSQLAGGVKQDSQEAGRRGGKFAPAAPQENLPVSASPVRSTAAPARPRPTNGSDGPPPRLPKVEAEVMEALARGPADVASIASRTAYPGNNVITALNALQALGKVRRVAFASGEQWARTR
jgi:hypothetical protein